MTKVEGRTLARELVSRGGKLPPREAAELLHKLASAIDYAHSRRVVHRDLKPGNVLLSAEGVPRITDFGLAKIVEDGQSSSTESDTVLGTPSYMAPEQARGATALVGPSADIYGLGAILYECLSGRPPYRAGNKNATLALVLRGDLKPPSEWTPDVPEGLEAICLKCLERDPCCRYASAEELAADLSRWLENKPTQVRPPGWLQRHRQRLAAAIILAAVVMGGGVAAVTLDPDRPRRDAAAALDRAEPVPLIAETGGPKWLKWLIGESQGRIVTPDDQTFTVETWGESLLELVPDTRTDRYRFSIQIRHRESARPGTVGLYVARQLMDFRDKNVHFLMSCQFNDKFPGNRPPTGGPPPPNRAVLMPRLLSEPAVPPNVWSDFGGIGGPGYVPSGGEVWRQLSVTVTPEVVAATWDGVPFSITTAGIRQDLPKQLQLVRREIPFDHPVQTIDPAFTPRGGIGLIVERGLASFRTATLTPLANDDSE
jgi:serine/threonine-protein kinase